MKSILIKQIEALEEKPISEISNFMDENLTYNNIDTLNWAIDFPYKPACKFKIASSKTKLYMKFYVNEENVKAQYMEDRDPVWKDSCVEFFCKLPDEEFYYNFEFNCIGTCLSTRRISRNKDIVPLTNEQFQQIERHSSLERKAFEIQGNSEWTLVIGIPFSLIGFQNEGKQNLLLANFYKCGDKTKTPHYLSWNPITTEQPDFHRPEFFGKLIF